MVAPQAKPAHAQIRMAIPVVFVSSLADSAAFFRDKLGFAIDFLHGKPPFYGGVSRNAVVLHLRLVHDPAISRERRESESLLAAFISVENVTALFEEYTANGVSFAETLRREEWGGPTFTVRDPDGNWILFCEA
jgi:catechol 2,3-dioxygenase-like lactoylglutathione lyase family enzyme